MAKKTSLKTARKVAQKASTPPKKGEKRKSLPEDSPAKRVEKYQWPKGVSGNPNGRPRVLPKLDKVLASILGGYDVEGQDSKLRSLVESLLLQAQNPRNKNAVRAAQLLLERAYGKAPLIIRTESDSPGNITGFKIELKKEVKE
jgi:hypothetical protein